MKTTIIIQARMSSSRLPGKILKTIQGISIIELIIKRLKKSKLVDDIIVATSNIKENKSLINLLKKKKIKFFCGSEHDALSRFYYAAKKNKSKIIVRITGDCPMADPKIVDEFVKEFKKSKIDYISNTNPWTYPDGFDVEVFSFNLLKEANKKAKKKHRKGGSVLISYLRDNKNYRIKNIKCKISGPFRKTRLTIDEKVDLELIKKIFKKFSPNLFFGLKETAALFKKDKNFFKLNSHLKLNEGSSLDKSQKIWRRANGVILGGNSLLSKNPNLFLPNKWPTYFSKAKGCAIWDLNKNKYIDMSLMGVGTNILGYCNNEVDRAVKKAINKSVVSSLNCVEEVYLAEKLLSLNKWADKVKFTRTGGEANALAIRIARAASKKDKVAFCGYHGWHDWYLAANLGSKKTLDEHLIKGLSPLGVPRNLSKSSFGFTYGNYNKLEKLVNEQDIGIIKMEVCRNTMPNVKFLQQVRNLANNKNIILIFDECTTGFRQNFGGIYKMTGVTPDIVIFGKALGNGYPITAVLGKDEIMNAAKNSFISSTFWSERIGPVAALKTLETMEKKKSWIEITRLGKKLISIWKKLANRHKVKIQIAGIPSLAKFSISSKNFQAYKTYISQEMLKKGFLASNGVYLSVSHNNNILRNYENALDKIFYDISLCEKGNISINEILKFPISHLPFERLN